MSLQWTLVAGYLYIEIALLLLLIFPIISPQRWCKIFKSGFLRGLGTQTQLYFYGLLGLLCILFLDAIREMHKYSNEEYDLSVNPKAEMQAHMKLFRAQRNFYIAGFALLLTLVIRRIAVLISTQGNLIAQHEAAMKQAKSASDVARTLMKDNDSAEPSTSSGSEAKKLKAEITQLKEDLRKMTVENETMRSQAKSVSDEYDRLSKEHEKVVKKLRITSGDSGDKKDD